MNGVFFGGDLGTRVEQRPFEEECVAWAGLLDPSPRANIG